MKTKILVADDDRVCLRLLQAVLERAGFAVETASNGLEAWSILTSEDAPTLAVLDWSMPGLEGIEICRRLHARESLTPPYIILLTGRNTKSDLVFGLTGGASDFISKPFDPHELLARVNVGERVTRLQATVQQLARYDSLTQILNRRALAQEAAREWSRALRSQEPLACVMFDIDFFKKINDTFGHAVGDMVIAGVASELRQGSRTSDVVARYGGEEFCALLPNTDEKIAAVWAERLRQRIAGLRFSVDNQELSVSASFGVSQRLENMESSTDLIDEADQALLVAKQSGRNQVVPASRFQGVNTNGPMADWEIPPHITAGEIMLPVLATLSDQTTLFDAVQFLLELRLDSAPVVDADGNLIDILGEEELARKICSRKDWLTPLSEAVTSKPANFDIHAPAANVFNFLMRVSLRRVVIVDGTKPVGVVTRGTLLRWLCNYAPGERPGTRCDAASESTASPSQDQALRQVIERLQSHFGGLTERIEALTDAEYHGLLVSVTHMQALCDDTLACVGKLCHTHHAQTSLDACLG